MTEYQPYAKDKSRRIAIKIFSRLIMHRILNEPVEEAK